MDIVEKFLHFAMKTLKRFDRRNMDLYHFDARKVKSILVVSSTGIGDTLMSTPGIRAIRERYPEARITALFRHKYIELFENNPHIDAIIPYYGKYKGLLRTIRALRKGGFDLAVIFHGNDPDIIPLAYLSGAPFIVRIPNDTTRFRFLLSNSELNEGNRVNPKDHGIETRLRIARLVGCNSEDGRMVLVVEKEDEEFVNEYLKARSVGEGNVKIGFQVGASTVSRMWFGDRFVELGRRLSQYDQRIKIIITGSPQEQKYCNEIGEGIGNAGRVIVTAGRLRLRQVVALVKMLDLLVTPDTGIMHMAVALGTRTVCLFAMADHRISGPYPDRNGHYIIQKWRTCDPCVGKACEYQECMENITVDEVFESVKVILSELSNKGDRKYEVRSLF